MNYSRLAAVFLVVVGLTPSLYADSSPEAARLFERAKDAARDKRFGDAEQALQQAIQLQPERAEYRSLAGWLYLEMKDYAAGLRESEAAVRLGPDPYFRFLAGENAYNSQELALAVKYFRAAVAGGVDLGPDNLLFAKTRLDQLSEKTYELEWRLDPKKAPSLKRADGAFLVPIPAGARWPFQKRNNVIVLGARSHKIETIDGNDVVALKPEGNEPMRVLVKVTVQPFSYKARLGRRTAPGTYSALVKPYLGASEWIEPKSRTLQRVVEPLRRRDSIETVVAIVEYLRKHLRYIPNEILQDPGDVKVETTLQRAQASCQGWSVACCGLCRAAGIPARVVVVFSAKEPARLGYHGIVEVYIPNAGWVPLEPQPGGVIGMPGTRFIRLYHLVPTRYWGVDDPDKIHLFNIATILQGGEAPLYNVTKK